MNGVMQKPILIVDDDAQMRSALHEAVQRLGYDSILCRDGADALGKVNGAEYAMIVTDMKMPKIDGLSFLKEVRKRIGSVPVLVITGFGTVENAVESMKEGATDYLMKPFSFDSLGRAIESIMARVAPDKDILTGNGEMEKLLRISGNLATSDITVLICGESGTGKELLARRLHTTSRRKGKPFVAVNCAAIPENLLESELFGHEKGAFTGAQERRIGRIEAADTGTILLDEIGEMPAALQAKLLRVLQEREVDRVGGKEPIKVDVRVIATTNRELARECAEGRFREDLFYRLNVFPLRVPPLRARPEDILLLTRYFVQRYADLAGKNVDGCSDEVLEFLMKQPWRGNVRELENVMQRAVFLCAGSTIGMADLMIDRRDTGPVMTGRIWDMERDMILKTLDEVNGNKTQAAKALGISVRTIRNKLHEYGKKLPVG